VNRRSFAIHENFYSKKETDISPAFFRSRHSLMPRCFSRVRYGKSVTRGVLMAIPGAVPPPVLLMTLSIPPFTVRFTVTR
jgi:hypothetical protein